MSPRPADPAVRVALIEAAAEIVASEGRAGLTLRRLASEVGTSTMAIYTHFGSMEELRRAVRIEGFARLRARLAAVRPTKDPVADLYVLGVAYYLSATSAPNLYRAMFLDGPADADDVTTGLDTFMYLVQGLERCVDAGRLPALAAAAGGGVAASAAGGVAASAAGGVAASAAGGVAASVGAGVAASAAAGGVAASAAGGVAASAAGGGVAASAAVELWALEHGLVTLQLAHLLAADEVVKHLDAGAGSLLLAWGDSPASLAKSYAAARRRLPQPVVDSDT